MSPRARWPSRAGSQAVWMQGAELCSAEVSEMEQQGLSVPGPRAPLWQSLEHTGMPAMRYSLAVPAALRAGLRSIPASQRAAAGRERLLQAPPGSSIPAQAPEAGAKPRAPALALLSSPHFSERSHQASASSNGIWVVVEIFFFLLDSV